MSARSGPVPLELTLVLYESPRCPLCRQPPDTPSAVSYSAAEAAQHFVLAEEYPQRHAELRDHITGLWSRNDCRMYACRQCALTYAWPFVAGDGHFYNLAYPYSAYPAQRWEFLCSDLVYAQMRRAQTPETLSDKVRSRPRGASGGGSRGGLSCDAGAHSALAGCRRRGAFARQFALGSLPALMRQSLCLGGASLVWAVGVVVP